MQTTDKETKLEWSYFQLPNIPIYETKLPQKIVDRLWGYVNKAEENWNSHLAGNIDKSLLLEDEDDYFMNNIVGPIANLYTNNTNSVGWIKETHTHASNSLKLSDFWVNFQNKHEYNPLHNHSGIVSFVVWMKIPTHWEDQHALPISANSNTPSASDFQFTYSDILGNHQDFHVAMSGYQEGWIIVFPSQLRHQVYPFFECDEQRISISGNISWNSVDLKL